jgi:hypothetical protein
MGTNLAAALSSLSAAWSWVMRASPMVPGIDRDVYLVLDDFGRMGCAWRETNVQDTDLEAVMTICWKDSTATRFWSLVLTSRKVGFATFPK